MKHFERSRLVAIPLAVALGLGATACSSDKPSPTLASFNLIGGAKDGGINAVNTGDTAQVYDPATYKDVGTVGAGVAFEILCAQSEPNALKVESSETSTVGLVNLTNELAAQVATPPMSDEIPAC